MSPIEITIIVILALRVVPDLCAKVGRPALTYLVYLFVGFLLIPIFPVALLGLPAMKDSGPGAEEAPSQEGGPSDGTG